MRLGNNDVLAIAHEARLSLTDSELEDAVRYVNNFLDLTDRFKELELNFNLKNVEPFYFPEIAKCPLREDIAEPFPRIPEILTDRCDSRLDSLFGSLFKVPRILEG